MSPDTEERRPAKAGTAPTRSTATTTSNSLPSPADPAAARRRWAYGLIRHAARPVPAYGSAEWANLADGDPDKAASCVVAAEAWLQDGENLVEDLHHEIDVRRETSKAIEDAEYAERAKAHRIKWARRTPTMTFVERRAEQLASIEPRPGDFQGRGSSA